MEWTGDWSFRSSKWTEQLKAHLNFESTYKKSQFYMSLEDYLMYFNSTSTAKYNFNKFYQRDFVKIKNP